MQRKNVMLIDDNEIDNFVAGQIINYADFARQVTEMTSVAQALEYLKNIEIDSDDFPDVIFLDVRMPVMDGFDFLDEFLKFPAKALAKCDIIMLTSSSNYQDIDRASQYPVVKKFLAKPLSESMLKNL